MSQEQPMQSGALAGQRQIRIRFDQLKRSSGLRLIGLPELIGLAVAALLVLITVFAYFYFLAPARARLNSAQLDRSRFQALLRQSQSNLGPALNASEQIKQINVSLEDFESNWLAVPDTGRMSLYSTLNDLIRSNGVRNTSGPTYTSLEPLGTKAQVQPTASAEKQSNVKWQSIYPGISVSVTVEGPYQNVRQFVRDIENSRQFLIINAVELESVTQTNAATAEVSIPRPAALPPRDGRAPAPSTAQPSGAHSTLVSLRLDMATYFRRVNTPPTP
jgi:Tfp pilus assembly protein PilO